MNPQPATPKDAQESFELKFRTLRLLWIAMFMSIVLYYGLTFVMGPREVNEPNRMVSLILAFIGLSTTLVSFPIKSKLITRAAEQQQVQLVQQGFILALALCETAALLGLLDYFLTGNRYFYILFIIAAVGQVFHFPRREHLINASPKTPIV